MKHKLRIFVRMGAKIVIAVLAAFLAMEAGLAVLCALGVLNLHKPSYSMANVRSRFWVETNPDFGVWHDPCSSYRHITTSYDVSYQANSYGARDKERTKECHGKKRVIVLGDLFAEGYGVKTEDRFSDRLEAVTGIAHLNYGTAGSFGPTQYYLLYKTLAGRFEHDAVMVCLLPFNDFLDDDHEYGKIAHAGRYRPYFLGQAPSYKLVYSRKDIPPPESKLIENIAREFSYTGNWLKQMKGISRNAATGLKSDYCGYVDYTPAQWDRLCHVLALIRQEAAGKAVLVLTLPAMIDIRKVVRDQAPTLSRRLAEFCSSQGMDYLDLLPGIHSASNGWSNCYYTMDPHWNAYGNEVAADYILAKWPWYRETMATSPEKAAEPRGKTTAEPKHGLHVALDRTCPAGNHGSLSFDWPGW